MAAPKELRAFLLAKGVDPSLLDGHAFEAILEWWNTPIRSYGPGPTSPPVVPPKEGK